MLSIVSNEEFQRRRDAALEAVDALLDFVQELDSDALDADFSESDIGYICGVLDSCNAALDALGEQTVAANLKLAEMGLIDEASIDDVIAESLAVALDTEDSEQ